VLTLLLVLHKYAHILKKTFKNQQKISPISGVSKRKSSM
jgi:hypothetical protein